MILDYLGILSGLILLVFGADRFVTGAANIARGLGMPPLLIGLTIVSIATSTPEILVGSVAALDGKIEIAIGNAIGSNIANIGMVLGLSVLILPVKIASKALQQEYLLMFLSAFIAILLMLDLELSRMDATILLITLAGFIYWILRIAQRTPMTDPLTGEFEQELAQIMSLKKSVVFFLVGLILMLAGAELLVRCSVVVARSFGISDLVIGLTIIAVGTSLPELAASLMSVVKKEADIAVGNVIGSNMFNMLAVIGVPVLIHPSVIGNEALLRDFPVMIVMTLLMGWMVFMRGPGRFDRIEGGVLLLCFIFYQYWLFAAPVSG
jgi:cation:H+ antiporter